MKIYIRANSAELSEELDTWVGKLYQFMHQRAFMDFPEDFPIVQTKKDVANGDVQKYIDYFNDIVDDQAKYMKEKLKYSDEQIQKQLKKWQDIVAKFESFKK